MAVNLVDGFFERNLTLQDDFRTFQVSLSLSLRSLRERMI